MDQDNMANQPNDDENAKSPTFLQMVGSVMASFFGVQNDERRERDFKYGKYKHFIAVGILMTAVWYGAIYMVVSVVLADK